MILLDTAGFNGQRLDKTIAKLTGLTRATVQELIGNGHVKKNGVVIDDNSYKIKNDAIIEYEEPQVVNELQKKKMNIDIVYEDDDLLIINKPPNLTTHPNKYDDDDTLVNALIYQYENLSDVGGLYRPGIVHRLDRDTSGLMAVAKNNDSHLKLKEQLQNRELKRYYIGVMWGVFSQKNGKIEGYMKRDGIKMTFLENEVENSRYSLTNYRTLSTYLDESLSMVEFELDTGRTHQIRCHCAHKKHPLIGDKMYGGNARCLKNVYVAKEFISKFPRQALHSYKISFKQPTSGALKEFEVELPTDIKELIKVIS
ncbi:MAG: RluA family pseudouridine synthase [Rickettsiales bacterium]|jgi:23S rRNA pseudouridine1911/1915/1917 synthase|nr:RluA family pseudouridine synthase [Rickettsiales bacterium]